MRKETLKTIKNYVRNGAAVNITDLSYTEIRRFLSDHVLEKIAYSTGVYGINGGVLRDMSTGILYAITARNSALMMAF